MLICPEKIFLIEYKLKINKAVIFKFNLTLKY